MVCLLFVWNQPSCYENYNIRIIYVRSSIPTTNPMFILHAIATVWTSAKFHIDFLNIMLHCQKSVADMLYNPNDGWSMQGFHNDDTGFAFVWSNKLLHIPYSSKFSWSNIFVIFVNHTKITETFVTKICLQHS